MNRSPLQARLNQPFPRRPVFESDTEKYCTELNRYTYELEQYLRRILSQFNASNIAEELRSDSSTSYTSP